MMEETSPEPVSPHQFNTTLCTTAAPKPAEPEENRHSIAASSTTLDASPCDEDEECELDGSTSTTSTSMSRPYSPSRKAKEDRGPRRRRRRRGSQPSPALAPLATAQHLVSDSLRLDFLLKQRPTPAALRQQGIIRGSPHSDPKLQAMHSVLLQKRQKDALSRAIKNRRTVEELMQANIIRNPEKHVLQEHSEYLKRFLETRPSRDQVKQAHVLIDVMMWTKVAPGGGSPSPTNCHTATWVNRKLFVVAGYSVPSSMSLTRVYDPDTLCWLSVGEYGRVPCQRYAHAAACVDSRFVYVFGGYSERYGWLNDVCMLDTETMTWSSRPVTGDLPEPRAAHSCTAIGKDMLVFGGNDRSALFSSLWSFDTVKWTWTAVESSGTCPSPRAGHTATLRGHVMFVFGGGTGWSGITYNDVFALDTTAMIWHAPAVTGKPPEPRAGHTAALIGSKIVIVGGGDHKRAFSDVHVLDTDAMSWSRPSVAGDLPSGRAGHSATAVGDLLIVFGGGSPQGALHNDLFVLDSAFLSAGSLAAQTGTVGAVSSASSRFSGYEHQLSDVGEVTEEESEAESHLPPPAVVDSASTSTVLAALVAQTPVATKDALRAAVLAARAEQEAEWDELFAMMSALRQEQRAQCDVLLGALQ